MTVATVAGAPTEPIVDREPDWAYERAAYWFYRLDQHRMANAALCMAYGLTAHDFVGELLSDEDVDTINAVARMHLGVGAHGPA